MPSASRALPASPDRCFQILEDPRSLRYLVVGARRVRRFDPRWPDAGSCVAHSVGLPPLVVRDQTVVRECRPPWRLLLEARLWPLGSLLVEFCFEPAPEGSRLTVRERPLSGLLNRSAVRVFVEGLLAVRNAEMCRRYRRLVERRASRV